MAVEEVYERRCIGCDECYLVCPTDVFRMQTNEQGDRVAVIAFKDQCQSCFLCEEYCPTDALYVDPDHPSPAPVAYRSEEAGSTDSVVTMASDK